MKKISIISILCLLPMVGYAEIASTEYVDSEKGKLESAIGDKMSVTGYTGNRAMATTDSGVPTSTQITGGMITDATIGTAQLANESVTNAKIATGTIDIKKLNLGTLPTSGKHILTWDNGTRSYKFEAIKLAEISIDWDAINEYLDEYNPAVFAVYGLTIPPEFAEDWGFSSTNYCEGIDINGNKFGMAAEGSCSDPEFAGMTAGDWYVDIPSPINIKIKGRALCSDVEGEDRGMPGNPEDSGDGEKQYCWCKMTSPATSSWVPERDYGNVGNCDYNCAYSCAFGVRTYSDFRSVVASAVGQ